MLVGLWEKLGRKGDTSDYNFFTTFYNQGNVHLKPKGEIYITNLFGRQVASVPANRDAQIVMPDSQRIFESVWQQGWRLGRYRATAVLYYGDPKLETRTSVIVWIVPWQPFRLLPVHQAPRSEAVKKYK